MTPSACSTSAGACARCVADGRLESPLRTLASSLVTLGVLDETRRQIGVVFAGEH